MSANYFTLLIATILMIIVSSSAEHSDNSISTADLLISPSDGVTVAIPQHEDDYDDGFFKMLPARATPIPHSAPRLREHVALKRESRGPSSDLISDIFYMTTVDSKMDDLLDRMDEMKDLISRSLSIRKKTRRELLSQILTASQQERKL